MSRSPGLTDYDKDNEKPSIKPDLGKRENVSTTPAEQLERIPTMSDKEGEAVEKRALADLDSAKESGSTEKSLYNSGMAKRDRFSKKINGSSNLKKYVIIGGFGAMLIATVFALFSFLNVFKLDGLMSSIEARAFLRNNAMLDLRSTKLTNAYVQARLLDIGDNPHFDNPDFTKDDNLLFRATRVDMNNPFFDWYRTMRASSFEQDVFEKHGIKFTSVIGSDGRFRPGMITIKDGKSIPIPLSDMRNIDLRLLTEGDIPTIARFGDIVTTDKFDSHKEARTAIKSAVNENTHWYEAWRRRALRKSIQNMTGVKDWRFFEKTRDKAAQKRIDIRNRVVDKMVPDTNMLGKVTRCLFGVDRCTANRDTASESNHADTSKVIGVANPDTPQDPNKAPPTWDQTWDPTKMSKFLRTVLNQANIFARLTSLPSTLDMLSSVDKGISHIVKLVVVARGAQAAGLFQVFETSRDQIKTGQVTAKEVNDLMSMVDTAGSSDGQSKVIDGKGDPSQSYKEGACSQEAQALYDTDLVAYNKKYTNYAYLCDNQRIGSADNAQKIQDDYNDTIGRVIGPIASIWDGANNTPVIGQFISVLRWIGSKISSLQDVVVNQVLSALNLKDDVNSLITYLFTKVSAFLGVAILNGNESPGTMFNWLVQGGAYSAESASRQNGSALTTPDSKSAIQNAIGIYQDDQNHAPLYDRVASLSNTNSLAFRSAMTMEKVRSNPSGTMATSINSMFSSLGKNFAMVFGRNTIAATPNGYAATKFADIETYDYPPKCYRMNPITTTPINGTNALLVFANPRAYGANYGPVAVNDTQMAALTSWDVEKDGAKFYAAIYEILDSNGITDNADDVAVKIYNCNLLDSTVRDSLGATHGYSAGPSYEVTSIASPAQPAGGAPPATTPAGSTLDMTNLFDDSTAIACAPGTNDIGVQDGYRDGSIVKIRLCTIPGFPSSSQESNGGFGVTGANGNVIVNSRASGAVLAMFKAAGTDGVNLAASSSFRTMAHQQQICSGNSLCISGDYTKVAKPGTSNHQMGLAIDFAGGLTDGPGPIPGNAFWNWLSQNAGIYGYKNYPSESWHWSPTGN